MVPFGALYSLLVRVVIRTTKKNSTLEGLGRLRIGLRGLEFRHLGHRLLHTRLRLGACHHHRQQGQHGTRELMIGAVVWAIV